MATKITNSLQAKSRVAALFWHLHVQRIEKGKFLQERKFSIQRVVATGVWHQWTLRKKHF
jgi:hypothetical protein